MKEKFYYDTKNKSEATEFYHIEKEATEGIRIIKDIKNPNDTHKYNIKAYIKEIGE